LRWLAAHLCVRRCDGEREHERSRHVTERVLSHAGSMPQFPGFE
jgi:hypothetical protein